MEVKEEIKKPKNGINKTAILIALILGLSVIGYGYLNISYKNKVFEAEQAGKEQERLAEEAEKEEQEIAEQPYNDCVEKAVSRHNEFEEMMRESLRKCLQTPGCMTTKVLDNLPTALDEALKDLENDKKECALKYKK